MHSPRVGSGEDIIGQSATRGSLLLSIRSLYQSCMSVRMNAILGDRKTSAADVLGINRNPDTLSSRHQTRDVSADFVFLEKRQTSETENNHHRSTFPPFCNLNSLQPLSICSRNYFLNGFVRRLLTVFPTSETNTEGNQEKKHRRNLFLFFPHQTPKEKTSENPSVHC